MHTKKTSPRRGKRKVLIIVLSVIFALALVISVALCIYAEDAGESNESTKL